MRNAFGAASFVLGGIDKKQGRIWGKSIIYRGRKIWYNREVSFLRKEY